MMKKVESKQHSNEETSTISNISSYLKNKLWDDITLTGEHTNIVPASSDEIRKVQNTLEKFQIDTRDIERWKNNN